MCAGSQTTNRHELNKIKRYKKMVGNVRRLHSRGLRCACHADMHDSTPTLCTPPKPCEQCCVRRPRVICGAVHRTQHTHCTTHASHPQTPPPTPVISRHAVATHTTLPQICDTAHPALDTLSLHPRLGTYCENLPGKCTPVMPASACAAATS